MFKYAVNCAIEKIPYGSPVVYQGELEKIAKQASDIGYDALELFVRNPHELDPAKLHKISSDHNIKYSTLTTGLEYTHNKLSLISDDPAVRKAAVDRLCQHIDLAKELDCSVIVGLIRGNLPAENKEKYVEYYIECLNQLNAYAAKKNVPLAVEAIMRYICNYLNGLVDTMDFLDKLNLSHIYIHIDSHHMTLEDKSIAHSVKYCRDRIGYVHFSDTNRSYPGGGSYDFKELMIRLKNQGYNGYIGMECQPFPTDTACAKRALDYVKAMETIIAVEQAPLF